MGYSEFVYSVLERDNYTCIRCGCKSKNMEVHHLDGYNSNPTTRTDVKNGVTLCEDCHNIFHRIYGHKNNTKSQFLEWMQLDDILLNSSSTNNVKYSRLVYCLEDKKVFFICCISIFLMITYHVYFGII